MHHNFQEMQQKMAKEMERFGAQAISFGGAGLTAPAPLGMQTQVPAPAQ